MNEPDTPRAEGRDHGAVTLSPELRGFRKLDSATVLRINRCKEMEAAFALFWFNIAEPEDDPRLRALARTHFEQGVMTLIKSISRPEDPFAKVSQTKATHLQPRTKSG